MPRVRIYTDEERRLRSNAQVLRCYYKRLKKDPSYRKTKTTYETAYQKTRRNRIKEQNKLKKIMKGHYKLESFANKGWRTKGIRNTTPKEYWVLPNREVVAEAIKFFIRQGYNFCSEFELVDKRGIKIRYLYDKTQSELNLIDICEDFIPDLISNETIKRVLGIMPSRTFSSPSRSFSEKPLQLMMVKNRYGNAGSYSQRSNRYHLPVNSIEKECPVCNAFDALKEEMDKIAPLNNTQVIINIPKGYKLVKEHEPVFNADGTGNIAIKIEKIDNLREFVLIKPYQIKNGNKILEVPIGTKVKEELISGMLTKVTTFKWNPNIFGFSNIDKGIVLSNPEIFKPIK